MRVVLWIPINYTSISPTSLVDVPNSMRILYNASEVSLEFYAALLYSPFFPVTSDECRIRDQKLIYYFRIHSDAYTIKLLLPVAKGYRPML
jgi:hypothetical protein